MKITAFTDYALRTLLMLAERRGSLLTIAEVADYFLISEAHLMKVTHLLGRSGWVETVRGRNGGMRLIVNPDDLTLDEVVAYLEGEFALAECFTAANSCRLAGACGLELALQQAGSAFNAALKNHTLASISRATRSTLPTEARIALPTKVKLQAKARTKT